MTSTAQPGTGPLTGTLVVDLTRALAGPHATMMLGDLGARVIKVEIPGHGDDTRGWGPPFVTAATVDDGTADDGTADDGTADDGTADDGTADDPAGGSAGARRSTAGGAVPAPGPGDGAESTYFLSANRNKESLTLDLKADADREVLLELVRRADVLVENYRTGVLERLGLGIERLQQANPRLVVLSITGFGHDGPEGGRAGYDQIAQAEAGLLSLTGSGPEDPQKVGVPISDLLAGMYGAYGVLAALLDRDRTGRGTVVRTSLLAATVGVHAFQGTRWTVAGQVGRAQGNHHASIAPYGLFACADGGVTMSVGSEGLWRRFCAAFELDPATPGLATNAERVAHLPDTIAFVEAAFASWSAPDLLARLADIGVPAGKVRTLDEVYGWDQVLSQGLTTTVEHATLGEVTLPGPPLRFFAPDGREVTRTSHAAPPVLDQHGASIRAWLAQTADPNPED